VDGVTVDGVAVDGGRFAQHSIFGLALIFSTYADIICIVFGFKVLKTNSKQLNR